MSAEDKRHRAGETIRDLCRACKTGRDHTVIAVDAVGNALRVSCDFCGSQHNYRGGEHDASAPPRRAPAPAPSPGPRLSSRPGGADAETPAAPARPVQDSLLPPLEPRSFGPRPAERERTGPVTDERELEAMLRRVLREELGLSPGLPAPKWRGGEMVLRPGRPGLQEKSWPIDALFHKVVMIRNRLRTLEQQLNAAELPEDLKLPLQSYVSGCYGSLTSFNVLFADEAEQFKGGAE